MPSHNANYHQMQKYFEDMKRQFEESLSGNLLNVINRVIDQQLEEKVGNIIKLGLHDEIDCKINTQIDLCKMDLIERHKQSLVDINARIDANNA